MPKFKISAEAIIDAQDQAEANKILQDAIVNESWLFDDLVKSVIIEEIK